MKLSVSIVLIGLFVFAYEGGSCTAAILASRNGTRGTHRQQLEDITVTISTPAVQSFDIGETLWLPCQAYHNIRNLSLAVFWSKESGLLPEKSSQTNGVLMIEDAQHSDSGVYVCRAQIDGRFTQRTTIIVGRREAPVVEVYPREPQIVRIGESAMLSCRAIAGIPTPTVVWSRKDGAPLSRNIEEKYQGTILISDITFADAGKYECKASNIAGESSRTATINIQQAPEIHISPNVTELTLTEGGELRLDCSAQGSPSPAVYWTEPRGLESSQGTIHKYNIGRKDEGTYVCHARNDAGEDQKYIRISIEQKHSKQLTTIVGYSTNISCHTEYPNSTKWRRQDGQPLPSNSKLSDNNLIIPYIEKDAAGIYECILHAPYGSFRMEVVEIVVVAIPKITLNPEKTVSVRFGEHFNISCNASGDEPISISWHTKNHTPFPADVFTNGGYLEFFNVTQNNVGTYYCIASNPYADVTKTVKISPDVDS